MVDKDTSHTTEQELRFIDGLGTHAKLANECSRQELLEKYILATELRTAWAGINKVEVVKYAMKIYQQYFG